MRNSLIIALGCGLAVVLAVQLANAEYLLAAMIACWVGWIVVESVRGARPDACLLAAALFGYVVGNRGFAQISILPQAPLLFAEATLAVTLTALLLRAATRQSAPFPKDFLSIAIAGWMLLGAVRLPGDLRAYGVMALRDFATVYYALFFFVAQSFAAHAPSERLLRRALQGAVLLLPITFALSNLAPEAMFRLQLRGIPVILYKEDLVAAALIAGVFLLLARPTDTRLAPWRWLAAAVAYGVVFSIGSSRAALAGLLATLVWWALARRWRPFKLQAVLVPAGLAALSALALFGRGDFRESRLYALYEHVASMVDVSGGRKYSSPDRQHVGDNNRFRREWWRVVAEETLATNPILGAGFGYDLTTPFVRNYEFDLGDDFTTRSPHSIVMTVFGRMGALGLAAWIALVGAMARATWLTARSWREGTEASATLGWWSVAWVYLTSACFGVVLEGPMGAIVFWTALGIAHGATRSAPVAGNPTAATPPTTPAGLPTSA